MLPVHIFGCPAAMEEIERPRERRGIGLLEDAAQALGTVCADGRRAGARGNPAAFAFYANKQMTTGEGGHARRRRRRRRPRPPAASATRVAPR